MTKRRLRVCVIDDDPIALRVNAAALRSLGHDVTTRERALGSLSAILREQPEVVVLDLAMPGLSGAGLGGLIREASAKAGRPIAIVICSGASDEAADEAARKLGALAVVAKGAPADALRAGFAAALAALAEPA